MTEIWRRRLGEIVSFLRFIVLTYAATFLPWVLIGRVKFIYHYLLPVLLLHIITAIALNYLWETKHGKKIVIATLVLGCLFYIFFLPLLMGLSIPQSFYRLHLFTRSWI